MNFKEWHDLANEYLNLLKVNRFNVDPGEILNEISEIQNAYELNREQMEILLDSYMVLKLKLPIELTKRESKKNAELEINDKLVNYLSGDIDLK